MITESVFSTHPQSMREVLPPTPPDSIDSTRAVDVLEGEVGKLSEALALKFEQLTLIHGLSEHLEIQEDSAEVCEQLLEDLLPCIDATAMMIELFADEEHQVSSQCYFTTDGEERISADPVDWLGGIADQCDADRVQTPVGRERETGVIVCNDVSFRSPDAHSPNTHFSESWEGHCIVMSIKRRELVLGRLIAIRDVEQEEFGTVEADLLRSMTLMLAVHWLNQRHYNQLQAMFESTIGSLVSALDAKDAYTCGHSSRVAELSVELASRLGYNDSDLARIHRGGILHDIGKIGIEDSVLGKPGRLTDEEFEKIRQHPVLGYEILKGIRLLREILPAVRHHHEAWDGSGYPDALAGEAIPRDAQIMAVADAFDAMTSDRPYRKGMPLEKVFSIFCEGQGKQWASDVVDVMLAESAVMYRIVKR